MRALHILQRHWRSLAGTLLMLAGGIARPANAQSPAYWITDLGRLPGYSNAWASGLNARGQVVGTVSNTGSLSPGHAFLWTPGGTNGDPTNPQMKDLGTLGGVLSVGHGINDAGQVVGKAQTGDGAYHAFLYSGSILHDLGLFPGYPNSEALAINASGQIAGSGFTTGGGAFRAFRHTGLGPLTALDDLGTLGGSSRANGINATGQVIGASNGYAFRTAPNAAINPLTDNLGLLGGDRSWAFGLNDAGQVVGYSGVSGNIYHAFLYSGGAMQDLGTLFGGLNSEAVGINTSGQVVGDSEKQAVVGRHAFLYSGGVMRDLNDLLPAGSGWSLRTAYGINDRGQIVGTGSHGSNDNAFLLTPIAGIQPDHGGNDSLVTAVILSPNLPMGTTVRLTAPGQPDIVGTNAVVQSADALVTTFDLRGAAPGPRSVSVTPAGGPDTILPNSFTVEAVSRPDVWIDFTGQPTLRNGREATYQVVVGNRGNVDAIGVPIWIAGLPADATVHLDFAVNPPPAVDGLPMDWNAFPVSVTAGGQDRIPLIVPRIPPGLVRFLQIRLTFPSTGDFPITFWVSPLYHLLSPTTDNAGLTECFKEVVRQIYSATTGHAPGDACLTQAADHTVTTLLARIAQVYENPTLLDPLLSLTQLLAQETALAARCEGEIITNSALATALNTTLSSADIPTCFGKETLRTNRLSVIGSIDPNQLGGPVAYVDTSGNRWVSGAEPLPYTVSFENIGTGAAQEVRVTDNLDITNLDMTTLSLGSVAFAGRTISPIPDVSPLRAVREFDREVDLGPDRNLKVTIEAAVDLDTGALSYALLSRHPDGTLPDPAEGFLFPGEEGHVAFAVYTRPGLPTGTIIRNQASIQFDNNPTVNTSPWVVTLDNDAPASQVQTLPAEQTTTSFDVFWSSTDIGSSTQDYTIFMSEDNHQPQPWIVNTTDTHRMFTGQFGHQYAFYSVARDNVGNREQAPVYPDSQTRLLRPVTVSGVVTLQEAVNRAQPITFVFRPRDNGPTFSRTVTLSSEGAFTLSNIPGKEYYIWIKGPKWLAVLLNVDASEGNIMGLNAVLLGGDANDDNSVDILDLDLLLGAFDSSEGGPNWDPNTDFNCDDAVDILDLDLLLGNFDVEGAP